MIRLFVNIDHVATVREARKTIEPDPLQAAFLAQNAGAYGITAHLREDRRHVQDDDIRRLKEGINIPFNLEMAAVEEMINIALITGPLQVSIVPEKRQEITTEGGPSPTPPGDPDAALPFYLFLQSISNSSRGQAFYRHVDEGGEASFYPRNISEALFQQRSDHLDIGPAVAPQAGEHARGGLV